MAKDNRRDLAVYRNKVKAERIKANRQFKEDPESVKCHICRQPIDMTLDYSDKWAWTLDHIDAISNGGSIMGVTLYAHRSCNSKKNNKAFAHPSGKSMREW